MRTTNTPIVANIIPDICITETGVLYIARSTAAIKTGNATCSNPTFVALV